MLPAAAEARMRVPRKSTILLNGVRRRCPRCGGGRLFRRWLKLREVCPNCGLRYLLNQGDPWAFLLVVDRVFLLVLIAIIYFKLWPKSLPAVIALFAAVIAVFVATMPHRYGLCVALDYWTRTRWGDPADEARRAAKEEART